MSKNVYYILCGALVVGFIGGYFYKDTKVITKTVESQTDKATITNLQQQLSQKTKTHTEVIYVNGVKAKEITDIDVDIKKDTNSKITENEKISQKISEKVEINPKKYVLGAGYDTKRNYFITGFAPVIGPIGITGYVRSNLLSDNAVGFGFAITF